MVRKTTPIARIWQYKFRSSRTLRIRRDMEDKELCWTLFVMGLKAEFGIRQG